MSQQNLFKRRALAIAIAMATSGAVLAQSNSQGYVFGQASANATVTVVNLGTGQQREITADSDGNFRASALPTGRYRVTVDGISKDVTVNVGVGTPVSFAAQLGVVEVSGDAVSPIDVSTVDSTTIFTEQEVDSLPTARAVTSVALLAPGAIRGDTAFSTPAFGYGGNGNAVSFSGSSVAENAYFINGFNVTNMFKGLAFSELPFEAIAEQQVKTGGYGAEFGRSLGGVVNIVTKRGSNEWKFGASAYFEPGSLDKNRWIRNNNDGTFNILEADSNDSYQLNVQAGGPLIKDRLFVYALAQLDQSDTIAVTNSTYTTATRDRPQGLLKLDWNISDNHILEVTAFRDRNDYDSLGYQTTDVGSGTPDIASGSDGFLGAGGKNYVAKWTGYLSDNFTMSALFGTGEYSREASTSAGACPVAIDARSGSAVVIGCYNSTVAILGKPGLMDSRDAYRIDADWVLGDHAVRFGVDREDYQSVDGNSYSGAVYWRYIAAVPGAQLSNGAVVPDGVTEIVRKQVFDNGGTFDTLMSAWYVEDRWQATDSLLLYAGLRNEGFENKNSLNGSFLDIQNTWAPRLGFSWDMNGDGTRKVFGNAGRYYIPIMSNTNSRLAGAETFYQEFYLFNGVDAVNGAPVNLGAQIGGRRVISGGVVPDPRTVVDNNLEPMYQDEFIVGFEQQVFENWALGVRALHRNLGAGMDDYCSYAFPHDWAISAGYTAEEADAIGSASEHCFLTNIGRDLDMNVDLHGTGELTRVVIPAAATGMPELERKYNALEFSMRRSWDDQWFMSASWTISHSYGNIEGYVNSDFGQDDSGITQSFDHPGLAEGAYGDLPNDRRHAFKVYGAYKFNDEWQVGADLAVLSGRPRNCFQAYNGTYDPAAIAYGQGAAFYCTADRVNGDSTEGVLAPRGTIGRTPWIKDLGLGLTYTPSWAQGVAFKLDVTNLFDSKENYAAQEQGDDAGGDLFNSFGFPTQLQPGRSVRFGVSYDF